MGHCGSMGKADGSNRHPQQDRRSMRTVKDSIITVKSYEDRRYPCRSPLLLLNKPVGTPSTNTEDEGVQRHSSIQ